jgi:iron complex transport system ATP-binding protein
MTNRSPLLRLDGVSVHGRGRPRLQAVDLRVWPGEVIGLLGANGSGKSTLLHAAAGLLRFDSGHIHISTLDVATASLIQLARVRALVEQQPAVDTAYTVTELVDLGRAPFRGAFDVPSDRDRVRVEDALAAWELRDLALNSAEELSGGERRRVDLARAFVQDPAVLLLDEPDAFLDVRTLLMLETKLRAWVRSGERGALIAVHDLVSAARLCDRVVVLTEGCVTAEGTPAEALTSATLRAAFRVDVDVKPGPPFSLTLVGASCTTRDIARG